MSRINSKVDRVYPVDYMFQKVEELSNLLENDVVATKEKVTQLSQSVKLAKLPKFYNDFSNKQNGSIQATDSGQSFDIWDQPTNASGFEISNGKLIHGLPISNNGASYLEITLEKKISRIGGLFSFPSINNGGSVCFASFENPIVTEMRNGNGAPNAGLHIVVTPTYIHSMIYKKDVTPINLGIIYFDEPLIIEKEYAIDIIVENSSMYIILPDGSFSELISHPEIEIYSSNYATFELYEEDTSKIPAEFVAIWADDGGNKKTGNNVSHLDLINAIKTLPPLPLAIEQSGIALRVDSVNDISNSGYYQSNIDTPNASFYHVHHIQSNPDYAIQYAWEMLTGNKYKRIKTSGIWDVWTAVAE